MNVSRGSGHFSWQMEIPAANHTQNKNAFHKAISVTLWKWKRYIHTIAS